MLKVLFIKYGKVVLVMEELTAYGQKSFYGKAKTEKGKLYSYGTLVCSIIDGNLYRHWDDYSATTMRHINSFLRANGLSSLRKKEWESMEVK